MSARHNCPACGCYFGMLGLTGGPIPGTRYSVEGLVQKNIRLAAEVRRLNQALARKRLAGEGP